MRPHRKLGILLILAMNLVVLPLTVAWTALGIALFPVLFFLLRIITRKDTAYLTRWLIWLYGRGWLVIMAPFARFRCLGLKQEEIKPPCILVSNHCSFFDIYCTAVLPYGNISIAVRNWPFKMPWYAPFMRMAGYINVENATWEETSKAAAAILSKGGAILWYPEGHRSRDGQLQKFYYGAFKVAMETGVKIVPLCIKGTHEVLPPGRWWLKPSRITIKALEPLDPRAFNEPFAHRKLRDVVWSRMAQTLMEMTADSGNRAHVVDQLTSS